MGNQRAQKGGSTLIRPPSRTRLAAQVTPNCRPIQSYPSYLPFYDWRHCTGFLRSYRRLPPNRRRQGDIPTMAPRSPRTGHYRITVTTPPISSGEPEEEQKGRGACCLFGRSSLFMILGQVISQGYYPHPLQHLRH
jgi:hypothetical protein